MKLKEYLEKEKISMAQLARHLECHVQSVRAYIHCKRVPSYEMAKEIQAFTQGEVSVDEIMESKPIKPKCPCCGRYMWGRTHGFDKNYMKKELVENSL